MKNLIIRMGVAAAFLAPAMGAADPSRPGPTHPPPVKPNPVKPVEHPVHPVPVKPIPPHQNHQHVNPGQAGGVNPQKPPKVEKPPKVVDVKVPSHKLNPYVNNNHKTSGGKIVEGKKNHPAAFERIHDFGKDYHAIHHDHWKDRYEKLRWRYHDDHYRYACSAFFKFGFFGGYYYPVRPCFDIEVYFEYPVIEWLYAGEVDPEYYEAYYGNEYWEYPVQVFPFAGIFYPTDTLRDLGMDASALSTEKQTYFRQSLLIMVDLLRKQISDKIQAEYQFGTNEIVLTHYENLKNEVYVLEGFVDGNNVYVPFKALLDLDDPKNTSVYAAFNTDPTGQDLTALTWINDRMSQFGGDPMTAYNEPTEEGVTPPVQPPVEPPVVEPPVVEPPVVEPPACSTLPSLPANLYLSIAQAYQGTTLWLRGGGAGGQWTSMGTAGASRQLVTPALDPCSTTLSYDFTMTWVSSGQTQQSRVVNVPVKSGAKINVSLP